LSLINEALKRARAEAARRDAAERGGRYPSLPVHAPAAPARRAWPVAVAVGIVVGALAAAGIWRWAGPQAPRAAETTGAVATAPRSESAPAGAPAAAPFAAAAPSAVDAPAAGGAVAAPAGAVPTAGAVVTGAPEASVASPSPPADADAASRPVAEDRRPAPAPTAGATPLLPRGTHLRRVELPGGERIELGGIAWSQDFPVALLNGQALSAGEIVAGYTVVKIEPAAVELHGPAGTIVLRLK
jgi:hypothetical protein